MITPVTAIVTAYKRHEQTLETVRCLLACVPPPAEVLVHVDGGRKDMEEALKQAFPTIRILTSESSVGPGGGRNRLVREARENLVASFDDDSHPADADFFQRVVDAATAIPDAAIIAATILDGTEESGPQPGRAMIAANFVGCGCVYRREVFVKTTGYVPLPVAYGMEEVDLSIRLHAMGSKIVHEPRLRVVHDLKHHHRG